MRSRNDFLQAGRRLVKKYCFGKKLPLFLPIDGMPEPSNDVKQNAMARTYRARSKVYQALSKLDERMIVLCGVIFSEQQSQILNLGHDTNTDNATVSKYSIEGKSDFIFLGPSYVVLIEASAMNCGANDQLIESNISFHASNQKKSIELIEKIISRPEKSVPLKPFHVHSFVSFPLIEKVEDFLYVENVCWKKENTGCISKFNLEKIDSWWDKNVKNQLAARNYSIDDDSLVNLVLPVLLVLCSVRDETIKRQPEPDMLLQEDTHQATRIIRRHLLLLASNNASKKIESSKNTQPFGDKKDLETNLMITKAENQTEQETIDFEAGVLVKTLKTFPFGKTRGTLISHFLRQFSSHRKFFFVPKVDCIKTVRALAIPIHHWNWCMGQKLFETVRPRNEFFVETVLACPKQSYLRPQKHTHQMNENGAQNELLRRLEQLNIEMFTEVHRFEPIDDNVNEKIESSEKTKPFGEKKDLEKNLVKKKSKKYTKQEKHDFEVLEIAEPASGKTALLLNLLKKL